MKLVNAMIDIAWLLWLVKRLDEVSTKPSQTLSVVQFLNTSNSEMSVISVIEYGINAVRKS